MSERTEPELEGWYTDPFGRHEARWFPAGTPTKLVRDGTIESQDPPPDEPYQQQPQPLEGVGPTKGTDLRRADEAEDGSERAILEREGRHLSNIAGPFA